MTQEQVSSRACFVRALLLCVSVAQACVAREEALLRSAVSASSGNGKKGAKAKKGGGKQGKKGRGAAERQLQQQQGLLVSPLSWLAPSLLGAHVNATLLHPAWQIEGTPAAPHAPTQPQSLTLQPLVAPVALFRLRLPAPVAASSLSHLCRSIMSRSCVPAEFTPHPVAKIQLRICRQTESAVMFQLTSH